MNFHFQKSNRGFTLAEAVVGSAIFLLVALSAYKSFGILMDAVIESQAKIAATEVANESFEIMRNLPYVKVGIVGGIPSGSIPKTQTVVKDNFSFSVTTTIRSVDDPFDGTIGGTPPDTSPADYKSADMTITCTTCAFFTPLKFNTLFAPHSLETAANNGALFIQVSDQNGLAVPTASVHIVNSQTTPATTDDDTTDNTGWLKIVDAPPGTGAYNITVTKPGYSQDQTYPIGGAAGPNPIKPDSNVVVQQITQVNFAIDKLSSLSVSTVNASCVAQPSIGFSLTGTKLIGAPSVLKYPAHNFTTDSTGTYNIPNLEWDTYSPALTSASYDLAGTNPIFPYSLSPNTNAMMSLMVVPHVNMALLVSVKDSSTNAIDGATVRLQKTGFDQTKTTSSGTCVTPGQVFWNGLASGTYTMTVSKAGFQTSTTSVNVSTNWKNQIVTLTP